MNLKALREEVLEANLELVRRGLVIFTFGNASGINADRDRVVIKPSGVPYDRLTPVDLVVTDLDGKILHKPDTDYGINVSGYVIHGAIHRARPDVACVLHTHTRAGMAVAAMKCGLLPL